MASSGGRDLDGPDSAESFPAPLGAFVVDQAHRVDAEAAHASADFRPFFLEEPAAFGFAEPCPRSCSDEHANPALHDNQASSWKP